MLKFDDRFARQDRCEPPPEFPLASPCSSIVHHLSGLSTHALAPQPLASSRLRAGVAPTRTVPDHARSCLSCATGVLGAHRLAHVLNSLVRVSRRVGRSARNHTTRTLGAPWHRAARQTARATSNCEQFVAGDRKPTASGHSRRAGGVHRRRSSPARSVDAAAAYNTTRANASPPCRRASDDPRRRSSRSVAAKCTVAGPRARAS